MLSNETYVYSALNAILLSSGRWSMLIWVGCGLWLVCRSGSRLGGAALGLVGFLGLGWPLSPPGEGLLLVVANVQAFADNQEALELRLGEEQADVVLAIEKRAEQIPGLQRVGDNFSEELPLASYGMAFFCREGIRCSAWISSELGKGQCGFPIGLLRLEEEFCVMGAHVPPPVPHCSASIQPYVDWMTRRIDAGRMAINVGPCLKGDPVLAIGDFNAPQGSRTVRQMLAQGLRDAQYRRGIYASTWPAGGGFPNFPVFRLDHVFPGALTLTGVQQFDLPNSDHQALRVWIEVD